MSGMFALMYSDSQPDFVAPSGLATLARYPAVVLQAEMFTATVDSAGRRYAEGLTPAAWLERRGVETWAYLNPFESQESRSYGGPGETFRRAKALQIEQSQVWLRRRDGSRVKTFREDTWATDLRNMQYQDWLRLAVGSLPSKRLFVDVGMYHVQGRHDGQGGPDAERAGIIRELYADWRAQGMTLVVNGGFEAIDPYATGVGTGARVDTGVYPYANVVDGVAIECPGGQDTAGKWFDLVSYRNVHGTPDLTRLRRVVADWRALDKAVWLVCVWQRSKPADYTYSPFPTFEQHASFWIEAAQEMDCSVSVFADNSHAVWRENWVAEWGRTDGGEPQTTDERLAAIEQRLSALERAFASEA